MTSKDILYAAASLAVIIILAVVVVAAIIFLFAFGSPIILLGSIFGLGIVGLFWLVGILFAMVSFWYILYALMKYFFDKKEEPGSSSKTSYTIDRIKKSD
ncbi:Uncharacterised protein [Candidatus Bilamarchaeum dharawalense]|uniref:Uncharacterized protein n=1 Tax=Candidatus Bilamarchaeum dharawalense TaxID=2885759 RepID=A0A5E4LQS6_9ARCH|nr:Uncharacterised protein [Candidatus Bilamarchaeum dharawalense]